MGWWSANDTRTVQQWRGACWETDTDGTAVEEEHAGKPTQRLDGTLRAPRLWNTCQQLYGTRMKENAGPASFPAKTWSPPLSLIIASL